MEPFGTGWSDRLLARRVPITETNLRVSASRFDQRLEFLNVAALVVIGDTTSGSKAFTPLAACSSVIV